MFLFFAPVEFCGVCVFVLLWMSKSGRYWHWYALNHTDTFAHIQIHISPGYPRKDRCTSNVEQNSGTFLLKNVEKACGTKSWTGSQTRLITNPIIQIISTERPNPYQSLDFPLLSRPTNAPPQSSTSWHILISAKLSSIECEVYGLHFECHKLRVSPIAP